MRSIITNLMAMVFAVLGVMPCIGNDSVLERMKPLIEDETVIIGYVNCEKLDTTAILNNTRGLIETLLSDGGITKEKLPEVLKTLTDQEMSAVDQQWQQLLAVAAGGKTYLTEMLGVKEAYLVVRIGKAFPAYVYVAIPKTDDLNIAMIEAFKAKPASPYHLVTRETDDYLFLTLSPIIGQNDEQRKKNEQLISEIIGPTKMAARAELHTAYETVKDAPIWLLVAPPKYTKKVLAEIKPILPSPYQDIDIAALINGLRWKAVGIDPEQFTLNVYAETESDYDTQVVLKYQETFYDLVIDQCLTAYEESKEELVEIAKNDYSAQVAYDFASAVMQRDVLLGLKKYLLVTPNGNRFEVHWNAETARGIVRDLGIPFDKLMTINVSMLQASRNKINCANRFKMLCLGVHNYAETHKKLPAAYSVDKEGKTLHSWRVTLLPFFEEADLYSKIKLDEPWDSEYNKQFHNQMPACYRCPACTLGDPKRDTTYCMVVGPHAIGRDGNQKMTFANIVDGSSNTIVFVERKTPVCWMAPEDVTIDEAVKGFDQSDSGIGSEHPGGANFGFCDASVQFGKKSVDLELLKKLLIIDDGGIATGEMISK